MGTAKRERQKQGRQARLAQAQAVEARRKRFRTFRNLGIAIVLVLAAAFIYSATQGDDEDVSTGTTVAGDTGASTTVPVPVTAGPFVYGSGPCPAADGSSPQTITFSDPPQDCLDPGATYTATFDTTEGPVVVELDTTDTPGTANNFVVLSRYHYYDATKMFRTDTSIGIIQGGSPTTQSTSDPGPGYDLPDEGFDFTAIGGQGGPYSYAAGDLVMARTNAPNGGGAQYFLCVTDACSNLDSQGVYVKFGHVTEGLDVLESILALNVDSGSLGGAPSRDVTVNTVTIAES